MKTRSNNNRQTLAAFSSGTLIAGMLVVGVAGPTGAVAVCAGTLATVATQTTCVVPAGVTSMVVTVVGGNGGERWPADYPTERSVGGKGAAVTATIDVTPGQELFLTVGENGKKGDWAGGGGAYSSISTDDHTSPDKAIVIAGGGGGAGGSGQLWGIGGNGFGGAELAGGGDGGEGGGTNKAGLPGGASGTPGGVCPTPATGHGGAAGNSGGNSLPTQYVSGGGGAGYGGTAAGTSNGTGNGDGGSATGVGGAGGNGGASGGGGSGFAGGASGRLGSGGGGSSKIPAGGSVAEGSGQPRIVFPGGPGPGPGPSPAAKPSKPQQVKVAGGQRAKKFTVSWRKPAKGVVAQYNVQVNQRGFKKLLVNKKTKASTFKLVLTRKQLLRGSKLRANRGEVAGKVSYRIRVTAINSFGISAAAIKYLTIRL